MNGQNLLIMIHKNFKKKHNFIKKKRNNKNN